MKGFDIDLVSPMVLPITELLKASPKKSFLLDIFNGIRNPFDISRVTKTVRISFRLNHLHEK